MIKLMCGVTLLFEWNFQGFHEQVVFEGAGASFGQSK